MDVRALPARLETAELLLRRPSESDAPAVFERWATDREVTRYLTWRPHAAIDDTRGFLRDVAEAFARGDLAPYVIVERADATDTPIGMISVKPTAARAASIGYVLARAWWGRGYMTQAARGIIAALWHAPTARRVWSVTDVDNTASARVLEKAGLALEGVLRGWVIHPNVGSEPRDVRCYAAVR